MRNEINNKLTDLLRAEYQLQLNNYSNATTVKDWKSVSTELLELASNMIEASSFNANSTIKLNKADVQVFSDSESFLQQHGSGDCDTEQSSNEGNRGCMQTVLTDAMLGDMRGRGLAVIAKNSDPLDGNDFIAVVDTETTELEDLLKLYFHLILNRKPDEHGAKSLIVNCKKEKNGSAFWLLGAIGRSAEAKSEQYQWILNDDHATGATAAEQGSNVQ